MTLDQIILQAYPELTQADFSPQGCIKLQQDADGQGAYIAKWDYSKPLPNGLKVGK